MQKELAALVEALAKKRDALNAALAALSRVDLSDDAAPRITRPIRRKRNPKKSWTPERRAKFLASMAARRAKANGAIAGEGASSIPEKEPPYTPWT